MKNPIMPVLFVGHGSPLNAINNSAFAENWQKIADSFPKPRAILAISAHWSTNGQFINNAMHPQQIYDMYGFPKALYDLKYPAPGSPELVESINSYRFKNTNIAFNQSRFNGNKHYFHSRSIR